MLIIGIREATTNIKCVNKIGALYLVLLYSVFAAFVGPCHEPSIKLLLSTPIIFFTIFTCYVVVEKSSIIDWISLRNLSIFLIFLIIITIVLENIFPELTPEYFNAYRQEGKYSGIYGEPSYLGFSIFYCISLLMVSSRKLDRFIGALSTIIIVFLSPSATFVFLLLALFIYLIFIKIIPFKLAFNLIFTLTIMFFLIDFNKFLPIYIKLQDLFKISALSNLSSLVYVQGWQDAYLNLLNTNGMGLGLNMMGCGEIPLSAARGFIYERYGLYFNSEDGSFLMSKIVSEFGLLGIAFYLFIFFQLFIPRKSIKNKNDYSAYRIAHVLIFCFLIMSITRGPGYFSGQIFVGLLGYFLINKISRPIKLA